MTKETWNNLSSLGAFLLPFVLLPWDSSIHLRATPETLARLARSNFPSDRQALERVLNAIEDPNLLVNGTSLLFVVIDEKFLAEDHKDTAFQIVKDLLARGANPNLKDPATGWTPLTKAIELRRSSIAGALLKAGADPNAPGPQGPPLLAICEDRLLDLPYTEELPWRYLSEMLLASGANPNIQNARGTALVLAFRAKNLNAAKALLEKGAKTRSPEEAARLLALLLSFERVELSESLLEAFLAQKPPLNVHLPDRADTPLTAAFHFTPEHVHVLLKAGADPNFRTKNNLTPLSVLVLPQNRDLPEPLRIAELLLEAGADPNAEVPHDLVARTTKDDALGASPPSTSLSLLRIAIQGSQDGLVALLVKHHVRITPDDVDLARRTGNKQLAAQLLTSPP
jgi:ankyrin repeat protein